MSVEKKLSSFADAFELGAVLFAVLGIGGFFSVKLFGALLIGAAVVLFLIAYVIRLVDERRRATTRLEGSALVDKAVMRELRAAGKPLHIIRAVARVGRQDSVETFRKRVKKETQGDITEEDLEWIVRLVRVPAGALPRSAVSTVPPKTSLETAGPMLSVSGHQTASPSSGE
jgi:hypothetical protein